ncbi:MAG TPA: S8 family serine peptidase [Paucimonas sp.]|nr:S8 family serine peptidase [Paucimonas sp.]
MAKTPESGGANPQDNQTASGDGSSSSASKPAAKTSGAGAPSPQSGTGGRNVSQRKSQYLVTARRSPAMQLMGLQPLSLSFVEQALRSSPDIEVVDTVGPKNIVGALADGFGEAPGVLVAKMADQKAFMLHQQAQGRLIVERDQYLTMHDPAFQQPPMVAGSYPVSGPVLSTTIVVLGKDNAPIKDAEVYLFGSLLPASGITNERGQVSLSLFGETVQSVRGLYVKPKSDYWSFYQQNPEISTDEANVVGLRPLADWPTLANFPQEQAYGWGQKAMRLDQLPGQYRGQGIKVAVIDSGAAALTHDDLRKIHFGFDIVNKKASPDTWTDDTISHGSHCAGIISGADNALGIRGFAPDAEVHVCKLFPGGQTSQLIDALEYCIEKQIDVVNLSLGGAEPSEALEQQILRAKRAGIACIVAAGNSGGPVQYPASSPNVLAVAAIGKLNEFPPDSYHSQTITQFVDADGFFAAKFSCFGPEIAVCAPGVAITSSVPANNYAVWDGTSMAAPHVTGLAALVLAHHPDFQGTYKARSPERVERLFQIIKASCRRLNLGDATRTGFGMPDALVAVGLQPQLSAAANVALGTAIGSAAPQSVRPQVYADHQALAPQAWFGTLAGQGGQQPGGGAYGGYDPAYAAYMQALFSRPQYYGRTAW